eukprot:TRINITY_DN12460_c0_g1_i6.p1 TRINITY_DN12460_c0_g1~~TRINITY_DN12460_c0_g1_i6.p1  ORF type:complete len:710 (-),score=242.00 TRINITY_DN12460_c0_g1_i6:30-2159(-)
MLSLTARQGWRAIRGFQQAAQPLLYKINSFDHTGISTIVPRTVKASASHAGAILGSKGATYAMGIRRSCASVPSEQPTAAADSQAEERPHDPSSSTPKPKPSGLPAHRAPKKWRRSRSGGGGSTRSGRNGLDGAGSKKIRDASSTGANGHDGKGTSSRSKHADDSSKGTSGSSTASNGSSGANGTVRKGASRRGGRARDTRTSGSGKTISGDGKVVNKLTHDHVWQDLLRRIQSGEKALDSDKLKALLPAAAAARQLEFVRSALTQLTDAGLATSSDRGHLVRVHVARRDTTSAELALGEMVDGGHKPELEVFQAVLGSKIIAKHDDGGAAILERMSSCGTPPDLRAYNMALRLCRGGAGAVQQADGVLARMALAGVAPDEVTFRWVMKACALAGDARRAVGAFRDMTARLPAFADATLWMSHMKRVARLEEPRDVLTEAARMAERGVTIQSAKLDTLVLTAHARLGDRAAVERALTQASAPVTTKTLAELAKGYAGAGDLDAAERTLEALCESSADGATAAQLAATLVYFVLACSRAGDLPRILRWLPRVAPLGRRRLPVMVLIAVSTAHEVGDAAAADALWREAGGAAEFGLYKALAPPPEEGDGRGWTVLVDEVVQQPTHELSCALDVSSSRIGVAHAALRAEARQLRAQPPPAARYIFAGAATPEQHANAAAVGAVMEKAGVTVSAVPETPGLFKASVPEQAQAQ